MKQEQKSSRSVAEDEIDLLELLRPVWHQRKFILKLILLFFIFGLSIALFSERQYTGTSTFIPQTESNKTGNLGGLASLAGISLNGLGVASEIPPSLYPKIVNSVKFKRELLKVPITAEENKSKITYQDFYEQQYEPGPLSLTYKYTIGLPAVILKSFQGAKKSNRKRSLKSSGLIWVTEKEEKHFERLNSQISVISDDQEGTVELNFKMPQPLMAAEMAKAAEELLQKEVITYKIQTAKEQLSFTKEQFEEKKLSFLQKQKKLAQFRDRNQHISSAMAMNNLQQLEADYNFAFNIYTEMAKQLEQTKLQVSKDTPVFTVINPVSIPTESSAPSVIVIIFGFIVVGGILAISIVYFKLLFYEIKKKYKFR